MSSYADIDDTCPDCGDGQCDFKTGIIQGHSKRHRIGICRKCKVTSLITQCPGC